MDALRAEADRAGFDIQRLAVERGALDRLPYATNSVDIVLSTRADGTLLKALSAAEVLRALRPEGTAILGSTARQDRAQLAAHLQSWARAGQAERITTWDDAHGTWVQFFKPCSRGGRLVTLGKVAGQQSGVRRRRHQGALLTQFMETPFYIGMPAVTTAAGGRTFLAIGHIAHHDREWQTLGRVMARNGYNGAVLWERKLPEGYLVHRSAFIATKDTFYMMDGSRCLLLDARHRTRKGRDPHPRRGGRVEVDGAQGRRALRDVGATR